MSERTYVVSRSDDGIREEDLRDDEQEGRHVEILDAARLGDEYHQQGEEGSVDNQRPSGANPSRRVERHPEEAWRAHRLRHRVRPPRLHSGKYREYWTAVSMLYANTQVSEAIVCQLHTSTCISTRIN